MAITKIHGIKATVDKAIDYIINPDKTDEMLYVSSFACSPETAALDFKYTLDHTNDLRGKNAQYDENKAFHLIQAFAPGEVSYEEAHAIGKELAERLLKGKYSYVLTTHIDKGHIHNHLIFCAADNLEHNHYHDTKKSYYHIRNLSDELCKEHNLSVIEPDGRQGKKYNEWQAEKDGSGWKNQTRKDINICIRASKSYKEFILLMKARGYEIKGDSLGEGTPKYISFRPIGSDRFIRGSAKSLGKNYTKESIQKRIEQKKERTTTFTPKDRKLRCRASGSSFHKNAAFLLYQKCYKGRLSLYPIFPTYLSMSFSLSLQGIWWYHNFPQSYLHCPCKWLSTATLTAR